MAKPTFYRLATDFAFDLISLKIALGIKPVWIPCFDIP